MIEQVLAFIAGVLVGSVLERALAWFIERYGGLRIEPKTPKEA